LAAKSSNPEIQALVSAPSEQKHRENYSGRDGYYLGKSGSAVWIIRKAIPYGVCLRELVGRNVR
jgi:hypothetical protein